MKPPKEILDKTLEAHSIECASLSNYDELLKLVQAQLNGQFKLQNVQKHAIPNFARSNREGDLVSIYSKILSIGTKTTLEKLCLYHGDIIGKEKFDQYRAIQAETNSFEYKSKKYGMTKEEFIAYNSQRSMSRENFIRRYGEEQGVIKFKEYQKLQAYVGISLEYFAEKYGEETGAIIYEDLKRKKSQTLDGYVHRLGPIEGKRKFEEYIHKIGDTRTVSKISQEFLWSLYKELDLSCGDSVYFSELNREFGKLDVDTGRYYFYDFVMVSDKIVVEFNGDIYHANPLIYLAEDVPPFRGNTRTAKDIWEYDALKKLRIENDGFHFITVWEHDYKFNKQETVKTTAKAIRDAISRNK